MGKDITVMVEFENSKLNFAIMCNAQILIQSNFKYFCTGTLSKITYVNFTICQPGLEPRYQCES